MLTVAVNDAIASPNSQLPFKPLPAIGDFSTGNYDLTFKPPEHAMYCPLPDGWTGSDHGTIVFLEPPRLCYGAGYPSSGRGFEPAQTARIEIYYGYSFGDDGAKPPACKAAGVVMLFGKKTLLCRDAWRGLATLSASGQYEADSPAEFSATLVAKPTDLNRYLPEFAKLIASVRPCSTKFKGSDRKTFVVGHGSACPPGQWF